MFELMDSYSQNAVIKVIGVGGGGGNAVAHMVQAGLEGVEFICINTDAQALKHGKVRTALQIGCNITKGLGAGADPEVGRQAAMEDRDRIIELIEGCDMLFITAGMGGGTGTGAAPVVAQVAKELGILTVAVVTRPFEMEGNKRGRVADQGMVELSKYVDSLITIPNQKLLAVLGSSTTLLDAFKAANTVLQGAFAQLLRRLTGQQDVAFGTTVSGRPTEVPGADAMVGLLINTVPVRATVTAETTTAALLDQLHSDHNQTFEHEHLALGEIHRITGQERLFDTLFVYENYPIDTAALSSINGLAVTEFTHREYNHYPLAVQAVPGAELSLRAEFDTVVTPLVRHDQPGPGYFLPDLGWRARHDRGGSRGWTGGDRVVDTRRSLRGLPRRLHG